MSTPYYPSQTPSVDTRGAELPTWARGYRIALMVCHTLLILVVLIVALAYVFPVGHETGVKPQFAMALLFIWMSSILLGIPYLVANVVYAILWLTSLRGKGYRANKVSSLYLVIPPALAALMIVSSLLHR